ncbi:hypothetical protein HMI54_001940 [Coelomomyces lativittatus]|nr:hypothetical protein HMI55_000599 [Coelomomyces lativittatus]KAJ1509970.1 hypothetical protein HMI54_001940 [Coelomomyces lativittatus]KAJ1514208.1 hypothetical protein HMI56_000940 [Coelomomyces lativittatus]
MDSLPMFLFLLLFTSIPALISVNAAGIQTSTPLRFLYANEELEFGPLKVKTQFGTQITFVCTSVRFFLDYFASTLDIQTPSGELTDSEFAKKLDSVARELIDLYQRHITNPFFFQLFLNTENRNFIQKNHPAIKSYLMSVKKYLTDIVTAASCTCSDGTCTFVGSTDFGGQTYTDRLILLGFHAIGGFPSSWNPNMFDQCGNSVKCVVEAIRNTRTNREIETPPGSESNLENNRPKRESEDSSGPGSNLQTTSYDEIGFTTKTFQTLPSFIFFIIFNILYNFLFFS